MIYVYEQMPAPKSKLTAAWCTHGTGIAAGANQWERHGQGPRVQVAASVLNLTSSQQQQQQHQQHEGEVSSCLGATGSSSDKGMQSGCCSHQTWRVTIRVILSSAGLAAVCPVLLLTRAHPMVFLPTLTGGHKAAGC
jgi:hypothetical protein